MTELARHAAAMAHADQVFASAERQVDTLVQRMDEMRAADPDCPRVEQWLPLTFALADLAPNHEFSYHFLAAAILRLSEAGPR